MAWLLLGAEGTIDAVHAEGKGGTHHAEGREGGVGTKGKEDGEGRLPKILRYEYRFLLLFLAPCLSVWG